MKRIILPPGKLILVLAFVLVCIALQALIDSEIQSSIVVARDVSCRITGSWAKGEIVKFALDCNGTKAEISNSGVVASYIRNPGPLTCNLHKMGDPVCKSRD